MAVASITSEKALGAPRSPGPPGGGCGHSQQQISFGKTQGPEAPAATPATPPCFKVKV